MLVTHPLAGVQLLSLKVTCSVLQQPPASVLALQLGLWLVSDSPSAQTGMVVWQKGQI